jgi:hypothetical protein
MLLHIAFHNIPVSETLNEIINTLQYVSTSLDRMTEVDETAYMTAAQAAGLRNIVDSLQSATQECVGQL